jgi:hypothetical protein
MTYLDRFPLLLIFVTSLAVIIAASEIGRWLGFRHRKLGGEGFSTLEGATFGLLAMMIGFTFAMAVSRFDGRRHAVLAEASTIEKAALRVRLLPAPYSTEALKLLREYAHLRIDATQHVPTLKELDLAIAKSNQLQEQLWQQAMAAAAKSDVRVLPLVFDSLNQLFNAQQERIALLGYQVPSEVFLALYVIAALAIGFAGYGQGLRKRPSRLPIYLVAILVCGVIVLIEDIETAYTGYISVSQQPLIDAAARIEVP